MEREFELISQKVQTMLTVISTDILSDLMDRFGLSDDEISKQVKNVSIEDMENFSISHGRLYFHSNIILIYLILLRRQMGLDAKTYDC